MAWYLRWHSHKCILAQDPWVTCTETFMKPLSELLSLDSHSSLSPSTRKLKLQDMCFLQRCLCLVLWQKEKEKLWGLVASSGHHSCWNQKGNPVLIVSTLSYLKAFVMVATSAAKGPNSELWINEGEKNERFFSVIWHCKVSLSWTQGRPGFLPAPSLPVPDIHSQVGCCRSPAAVCKSGAVMELTGGGRESTFCLLPRSVASSHFPKFP